MKGMTVQVTWNAEKSTYSLIGLTAEETGLILAALVIAASDAPMVILAEDIRNGLGEK